MSSLLVVGSVLLLHGAYSSYELRRFTEVGKLTQDVILEIICGLVILVLATVRKYTSSLMDIKSFESDPQLIELEMRPNFVDLRAIRERVISESLNT